MKKWPKELSIDTALEFSKQACGTNAAFFPSAGAMKTVWRIHAEKIEEAMEFAYLLGLGCDATQHRVQPTPSGNVEGCEKCHGSWYHLPGCPAMRGG